MAGLRAAAILLVAACASTALAGSDASGAGGAFRRDGWCAEPPLGCSLGRAPVLMGGRPPEPEELGPQLCIMPLLGWAAHQSARKHACTLGCSQWQAASQQALAAPLTCRQLPPLAGRPRPGPQSTPHCASQSPLHLARQPPAGPSASLSQAVLLSDGLELAATTPGAALSSA